MLPSVGALFLLFLLRHSTVADEPVDAARKWLEGLQLPEGGWGRNTAKVVMAVALTDPPEVPSCSPDPGLLLSYHLLQEAWREGVDNIPRVRLAEYILALSSVCRNPLSFHGKNLIALLGDQPNQLNFQYAYTVLALCSTATSKYSHMYKLLFRLNEKQMSHTDTDTLAMAALSLQCIAKKHKFGLGKILSKIADDLESRQHPSGRFTNYHATILAVQVLYWLNATIIRPPITAKITAVDVFHSCCGRPEFVGRSVQICDHAIECSLCLCACVYVRSPLCHCHSPFNPDRQWYYCRVPDILIIILLCIPAATLPIKIRTA